MNGNSKISDATNRVTASVAVFDICDTLYYSNTTHDFIGYLAKRKFGWLKRGIYYCVNHRLSPIRYALIIFSIASGRDIHKKLGVQMLSGISRADITANARAFVGEHLNSRKIPEVHNLLGQHNDNGTEIILCSSSIEPVVSAIARELSINNFICTTLEYKGNALTGRIMEDVTGKKVEALNRELGVRGPSEATSDNRDDLALLLAAERGNAVVHSDRYFEFWNKKAVHIIDLRRSK